VIMKCSGGCAFIITKLMWSPISNTTSQVCNVHYELCSYLHLCLHQFEDCCQWSLEHIMQCVMCSIVLEHFVLLCTYGNLLF
jgi:hypothetical protein